MKKLTVILFLFSNSAIASLIPYPELDVPTYCFNFTATYGSAPSGCFQIDPSEIQIARDQGLTEVSAFAYRFMLGNDVIWDDLDSAVNDRLWLSFDGTNVGAPLMQYFYVEDNNYHDLAGASPVAPTEYTLLITDTYWQIVNENAIYTERVVGDGAYTISPAIVPVPPAIALFVSGLLVLTGIRKKKIS